MTIKKFANLYLHSDVQPFEVVREVNAKTVEIRRRAAVKSPDFTPNFVPGGFSAVCTNLHDQKWIITPDPEARVVRARLRKDGQWWSAYGRHVMADEPRKFYDYAF